MHYRVTDLFFLTPLLSLHSLLTPWFIAWSAQPGPFINKLWESSCQCHQKISLSPVGLLLKSLTGWFSQTVPPATWNRGSSCSWFQLALSLRVSKLGITRVVDAQLQCSWEPKSLETCLMFLMHLCKSMYRRFTQMEKRYHYSKIYFVNASIKKKAYAVWSAILYL